MCIICIAWHAKYTEYVQHGMCSMRRQKHTTLMHTSMYLHTCMYERCVFFALHTTHAMLYIYLYILVRMLKRMGETSVRLQAHTGCDKGKVRVYPAGCSFREYIKRIYTIYSISQSMRAYLRTRTYSIFQMRQSSISQKAYCISSQSMRVYRAVCTRWVSPLVSFFCSDPEMYI